MKKHKQITHKEIKTYNLLNIYKYIKKFIYIYYII